MISQRLQDLKEKSGWTRADIQRRLKEEKGLKITLRTISRWLNGAGVQRTYRDLVEDFISENEKKF